MTGATTAFAARYGRWGLVAGASEGVGAAFAEGLAARGLDVVLVARRLKVLEDVADAIADRHGVATRALAVDLAGPDAASEIISATADLEVGMLAYCAGADAEFRPFLDSPVESAVAMVQRNCVTPTRLCHHFAGPMVSRRRGGIVVFGSGAGLAGGPNMVAYGASKAFDMVFAEALWAELHDTGVDVLGLILGKTDTPALRRLEFSRGQIGTENDTPRGAAAVEEVIAEAFDNLGNGPTLLVGDLQAAAAVMGSMNRNDLVRLMIAASAAAMGESP